jgi:hypothetical protein
MKVQNGISEIFVAALVLFFTATFPARATQRRDQVGPAETAQKAPWEASPPAPVPSPKVHSHSKHAKHNSINPTKKNSTVPDRKSPAAGTNAR